MSYQYKQDGFSLTELLVVVGVVLLLIAVIVPSLVSFRKQQALQNTTNTVVSLLQEARAKTTASYNSTFYSVVFDTNTATLFTGGTYTPGAAGNKSISFESPVTLQSTSLNVEGSTISFERLKGTATKYGTITVGIPGGATRTITVTQAGVISRD